MVLANYCDDSGQPIPPSLSRYPTRRLYSTAGRAAQDDQSEGEVDVVALPYLPVLSALQLKLDGK